MTNDILKKIGDCVVKYEIEDLKVTVDEAVKSGLASQKILDSMSKALKSIGERYENGEAFVSDLLMGAETMKEGVKVLEPHLEIRDKNPIGKVIIGTVKGDIHDIGKNLVATFLRLSGLTVLDLGVDVEPSKFIDSVKKNRPKILALSTLLTPGEEQMKKVIEDLKTEGLRKNIKIVVGGAPINERLSREIGADGYADDALSAVKKCRNLLEN